MMLRRSEGGGGEDEGRGGVALGGECLKAGDGDGVKDEGEGTAEAEAEAELELEAEGLRLSECCSSCSYMHS